MAAAAAKLSYEELFKVTIGGRWFTGTKVSIEGENEEYKKGGIALEPKSLSLPLGLLDAAFTQGLFDEKSEKQFDALLVKEKLVAYASGAEKKFNAELTEAEGKALKGYYAIVYATGR
jgi:hypothetical protein